MWRICAAGNGKEDVLIISSSVVSDEADASFGQCFDDFAFYSAGDGHAVEGAVDGFGVIEGAGATFFQEICWVG